MIQINTEVALGKGDFSVTMKYTSLTKNAIKSALNDCRPSGTGRFRSVKKGQFDSAIEWGRGVWLYQMQSQGLLNNLGHHTNITFTTRDKTINYEADFTYWRNNKLIIEDVKPGKKKPRHTKTESIMVPGDLYSYENQHVTLAISDTNLNRINFLLTSAAIELICIPIIGSTTFYREARFLSHAILGDSTC